MQGAIGSNPIISTWVYPKQNEKQASLKKEKFFYFIVKQKELVFKSQKHGTSFGVPNFTLPLCGYRLVRPRTDRFHRSNRGSNPLNRMSPGGREGGSETKLLSLVLVGQGNA